MRLLGNLALVFTVVVYSSAVTLADTAKNISTGINAATGQQLANNAAEPNYVIAPGGTGGFVGSTLIARSTPLPPPYLPDSASTASRWIGINSGQGVEGISVPAGTYLFQTTIDLTGFIASTASINNARFALDDGLNSLKLNGTTIYTHPSGTATPFDQFEAMPANLGLGLFTPGVNTLTFDTVNAATGTPVTLRFEGLVTATPVPEPSAAVASLIFAGAISLRRRANLTV